MKRKNFIPVILMTLLVAFIMSGNAFAMHPLITDDAGTQGGGKFQVEINGQYDHDIQNGVHSKVTGVNAILTYGVVDSVDFVVGVPYLFINEKNIAASTSTSNNGISDPSLQLKWRFYEKDGLSLALKPGVTLPAGDEDKGLGNGKSTYSLFFIASKEFKPWAFHVNLGYIKNDNKLGDKKEVWHASLAGEVEMVRDLKAVANVGIEKNPVEIPGAAFNRVFALGGLIYSVSRHLDLDAGVKFGLTNAVPDYSILSGLTVKY